MAVFLFRAECIFDVCSFLKLVGEKHRIEFCKLVQDPVFPDVDVMIGLKSSIQELRGLATALEDCHVISESLEENSNQSKKWCEHIF